jgi:hypothetical protein
MINNAKTSQPATFAAAFACVGLARRLFSVLFSTLWFLLSLSHDSALGWDFAAFCIHAFSGAISPLSPLPLTQQCTLVFKSPIEVTK